MTQCKCEDSFTSLAGIACGLLLYALSQRRKSEQSINTNAGNIAEWHASANFPKHIIRLCNYEIERMIPGIEVWERQGFHDRLARRTQALGKPA